MMKTAIGSALMLTSFIGLNVGGGDIFMLSAFLVFFSGLALLVQGAIYE